MSPVILTERLLSLHAKIASGQGANGMLKTLTCLGKSEDMLAVGIAGTVHDNNGRTDDFLVVVEEEGDAG